MDDASRECELNDAFIRSFRDTADGDYIMARLANRAQLFPQFHWSSLQTLEKYLKCILTLNRVEAKTGHCLNKALDRIERRAFPLQLSNMTRKFIEHIDAYGEYRYLEIPYHTRGYSLVELDRAVWEIRRYCHTIDFSRIMESGKASERREFELELIKAAENGPPNRFVTFGGFLKKVIRETKHPERPALIWKNFYFGPRIRNRLAIAPVYSSVNSPIALSPELLDDFLKYAHLQDKVVKAYRKERGTR
jgi:hypothetical protein